MVLIRAASSKNKESSSAERFLFVGASTRQEIFCHNSHRLKQSSPSPNMSAIKPVVTLAVCGHVDFGKSTLVGHLLYLLGDISKEETAKNAAESSAMGESSMKWAWSLDKSKNCPRQGLRLGPTVSLHRRCNDACKNEIMIFSLC